MNPKLLFPLTCLLLVGCAGQLANMPFSKQRVVSYRIGTVQQVSIGDPIVDVENASTRDAYEVLFDCQTPSQGVLSGPRISKGDRFTAVAYVPSDPEAVCIREEGPQMKQILIHIYPDGRINRGWVLTNGQVPLQGSWPTERLFTKSEVPTKEGGSFRAQIIYSGQQGRTVKAVYREFADDYARPAFTQELQYNLDESNLISYKTIRIEIIKATNSSIEFRVLDDGGLPWLPK